MTIEIASNNTEHLIIAAIEQYLKKEKDDTILEQTIKHQLSNTSHSTLWEEKKYPYLKNQIQRILKTS